MKRFDDAFQDALNDMIGRLHDRYPTIDVWADVFDSSQGDKDVQLFVEFELVSSDVFQLVTADILMADSRDEAYAQCASQLNQLEQHAISVIDAWLAGSSPTA